MIKPIRNEREYDKALERIEALMDKKPKKGTRLFDEMEVLVALVGVYEDRHHPVAAPHPLEAIKFRQEQIGMSDSALTGILGNRSRKSEIFSGKRKLNLTQIRKLHTRLKISADVLIQRY